jgi:hypothetical protein
MFYILTSKFLIKKQCERDYLYIFIVGSIFYILIHWYLNKEIRGGTVDKIRNWIYAIMALDAALTYFITKIFQNNVKVEDEDEETNTRKDEGLSQEKKQLMIKKLEQAKKLQQLKMMNEKIPQKDIAEKKSIFSKSSERDDSSSSESKQEKPKGDNDNIDAVKEDKKTSKEKNSECSKESYISVKNAQDNGKKLSQY